MTDTYDYEGDRAAYKEGAAAFLAGKTLRENPYDFSQPQRVAWDQGWEEAMAKDSKQTTLFPPRNRY